MTKEQFGFLSNRNILVARGVAEEILHSIKTKGLQALILKIELVKEYDRFYWDFLRPALLQIGIPVEFVDWIMTCITSTNFAVLVNGSPITFFKGSKELRQGCPLSPLFFLLVVEGLNIPIGYL